MDEVFLDVSAVIGTFIWLYEQWGWVNDPGDFLLPMIK
jgi:hypothetical protein